MYTAILLDGTKNPVSIMLDANQAGEFKSGQKKSMAWAGNATRPAKDFNFIRVIDRKDGGLKEILIFIRVGVKMESTVPGLRMNDLDADAQEAPVTVHRQGEVLAEQFLYPEKYLEMGLSTKASAQPSAPTDMGLVTVILSRCTARTVPHTAS